MNILLAEDVFKATIKSPDVVASQELWLVFLNDNLIPNFYYSNSVGNNICLALSVRRFLEFIVNFMDLSDIDKVCEFYKANLDQYIYEQELEPDNVLIQISEKISVYEEFQW